MSLTVAIAPNFHLTEDWGGRLRVPEGNAWRVPSEVELTKLTHAESSPDRVSLFVLPTHLRLVFWSMLERQAETGEGDFVGFAAEVARFLSFKEMAAPQGAVFDLVAHGPEGTLDLRGVWSVMNLGDEPLTLAWPVLRLELRPGEGCLLSEALVPEVVPPGEEPLLLVTVRGPVG